MRLIYLIYYFRKLDWNKYLAFTDHVHSLQGWSRINIYLKSIVSVFRYNISLLEYFQFRFYEIDRSRKRNYAGTGYMYEYQLLMNPKSCRKELEDKRVFLEKFAPFVNHKYINLAELKRPISDDLKVLTNPSGKIVLKSHDGQYGLGIEVKNTTDFDQKSLIKYLGQTGNDLVEEFIIQHPDLMRLSPSGLNTVRIFTQLNSKEEVEILGCRLRISINSIVDNMAAGNIAASIDEETGVVDGAGVYSDINKHDVDVHPVTKEPIIGFKVPFWPETIEMVKSAALYYPACRSVGWDIAITENGPELVEGNHDWCKLVWQLPVKEGLKPILEKHKLELKSIK